MATYTYSVVGAGSSVNNPVTVYHDCGVGTVLVCWTGRLSTNGKCGEDMHFDEEYCDSVTVPSREDASGSITWTNPTGGTLQIYYKSISRPCPPDPTGCTSGCVNSTLTAYASPMYISDSGNTSIYYDSVVKCYGRISGVIPKSGITFGGEDEKEISFTTPYGCNGKVVVYKAEEDECTPGCKADLSVSVNRDYVPASGTAISGSEITFRYKKVTTDDECNKRTTDGIFIYDDTLIVNISGCTSGASGSGKEYQCCHDHYIDMDIPVSGLSKYLSGCTVYYDGDVIEITSAGTIPYSMLQKAKTSGECSGVCEERTTYCADSGSVKVCYEDGYLTNKWLCSGDTTSGCDCTSLSISGFNGNYAVPYTGGRIKVTWNYSAHTITPNCTEFDVSGGTWEEIITIGGCDERPTNCYSGYNEVVYHDEQGKSAKTSYDDTTYKNCKVCDSECCYDYDGKGTSKCVILFKEQTPGCTTCDSCTVWDDDEKRNITYNKIRYEFVQDCNAPCDYQTVKVYSAQTYTINECDYPGGDITVEVPFTSTTEYTGMGCPPTETKTGKESVTKHIAKTKNTSHMDRVIYEDDMLRIVQKSGDTCVEAESCKCEDLTIDFPDTPTPPGPTPPGPTPTDFDGYIKAFETAVGHTFSSSERIYEYLHKLYTEAEKQFNNSAEKVLPKLYEENNFPNVYYYYGTKGTIKNAFATLVGWLFALQLAELKPKNRTAIFKTGYELGGYTRESDVFGYNFKTDPNVARLVASGIYAAMRTKILGDNVESRIETMRTEINGSKNSYSTLAYCQGVPLSTEDGVRNNVIKDSGFYVDLRKFMPYAPGPYDTGYLNRPTPIIPDKKTTDTSCANNTDMDLMIHTYIIDKYNLDNPSYESETVQAIADKDWCKAHLFGPDRTATEDTKVYEIHPVFGRDTIGKEIDPNKDIASLTDIVKLIGSESRKVLQNYVIYEDGGLPYGRLRPGCSWKTGGQPHCDPITETCPDKYNILCNIAIEDGDGCNINRNTFGSYNSNGDWVYTTTNANDYCDAERKAVPANSYPSGHSSGIWAGAMILMELFPDKTGEIMKKANQFAVNRTIARYHWTSDTIMGRVLGSTGNAMAHDCSDFYTSLNKAKTEAKN